MTTLPPIAPCASQAVYVDGPFTRVTGVGLLWDAATGRVQPVFKRRVITHPVDFPTADQANHSRLVLWMSRRVALDVLEAMQSHPMNKAQP